MTDVSSRNFGFLIAYVIPGFIVVASLAPVSPTLRGWLSASPLGAPTIGGFLYATLASVAAGMAVTALRWLVLDTVHHLTGVPQPAWDFSTLQVNLRAFQAIAEQHYRYYQHFGNTLVAVLIAAANPRALTDLFPIRIELLLIGIAALAILFFVASRDALRKYYARGSALLGVLYPPPPKERSHDQRFPPRPAGRAEGASASGNGRVPPTSPGSRKRGVQRAV